MHLPDIPAKIDNLLVEFNDWCNAFPGAISDSVSFTGELIGSSDKPIKHAVIIFMQHGDEWGTLPVVLDLLPWLKSTLAQAQSNTKVTIILGNPRAAAICDRWFNTDLNRCYPPTNCFSPAYCYKMVPNEIATYESIRAKKIASIIASAHMVLDLHQTSQAVCEPFFIFPFHRASVTLAQQMNCANTLLTRNMGQINEQERCIDDFAHALNIPTVVIEVGQKGDNFMSRKCTNDAIISFVRLATTETKGKTIAKKLRLLYISERYRFSNRADMVAAGLVNLTPVQSGTPLLYGTEIISAPRDGFVVFMQHPPRDAEGMIVGEIPQTAICFSENYVIP